MSPSMNPWEEEAYAHEHACYVDSQQALFHPTLYTTHRGVNIMTILTSIYMRPNPRIDIGPIDTSCAITVCDFGQPNEPIIYANEPFLHMTGYRLDEVMGKNCRFLQTPDGASRSKSASRSEIKEPARKMRKAVDRRVETQVTILNYKKSGQAFHNLVTIIPIEVEGRMFGVGLQHDMDSPQ
ncbi:hypothetical protein OQA88_9074 [Cercophora sp. LCS_1]